MHFDVFVICFDKNKVATIKFFYIGVVVSTLIFHDRLKCKSVHDCMWLLEKLLISSYSIWYGFPKMTHKRQRHGKSPHHTMQFFRHAPIQRTPILQTIAPSHFWSDPIGLKLNFIHCMGIGYTVWIVLQWATTKWLIS